MLRDGNTENVVIAIALNNENNCFSDRLQDSLSYLSQTRANFKNLLRAHDCIQNGILLGVGGIIVANGNLASLPHIIGALNILSKLTGCNNVVVWDNL